MARAEDIAYVIKQQIEKFGTAVTEVKAILNRCYGDSLEEMAELERLASRKCISDGDTHRRMDRFFNRGK